MHLMKPRYLILSLILVLIPGAWLLRTFVAEQLTVSLLQGYGLTDVTADIRQLGLQQSQVSHLGFSVPTTDGRLRFEIDNASLSYSPGLLRNGKIKDLSVAQLYATYQPGRTQPPVQGTPADTSYQCVEGEYMLADEYDALIADPSNYFMRAYLPRVIGALGPWQMLGPWTDIIELPFVGMSLIPAGIPPV